MRTIRIIVCGFGRVGRAFAGLLAERGDEIENRYKLRLQLVAAVDVGGAAIGEILPVSDLLIHVEAGGRVENFGTFVKSGVAGPEVIAQSGADVLVETTPTNLTDGEPGRSHILAALGQGMEVVSANKGPLVLFYREIHDLARERGCGVHISAATAAALPTLDVGRVCLAGARVLSAEGILNGTTNYILSRMHAEGCPYEVALKAAQAQGVAETDPSLDVEGRDTANKMVLISNRIFGTEFGPADISVEGITGVTLDDVAAASEAGKVIKLIGAAEAADGAVRLSVSPRKLDAAHPLASVNGTEKALSYLTDTMDRITVMGGRSSPQRAGAALLKDLINAFVR